MKKLWIWEEEVATQEVLCERVGQEVYFSKSYVCNLNINKQVEAFVNKAFIEFLQI